MSGMIERIWPEDVIRDALAHEGVHNAAVVAVFVVAALDAAGCILGPPPLTSAQTRKLSRQRKAEMKGFRL